MREPETRRARVDEPHVAPLNDLARRWRVGPDGAPRFVPWFDPDSGGVGARVLVLMESPGPRTVELGDLGFSSEDNADPTAAALREARQGAGLARGDYLRWNVVPWPAYDAAGHRRAPQAPDLAEARPALGDLLALLDRLELVVAVGAPALTGIMRLLTLDPDPRPTRRLPHVLGVPHPSPRNAGQRAESRARLRTALAYAAR